MYAILYAKLSHSLCCLNNPSQYPPSLQDIGKEGILHKEGVSFRGRGWKPRHFNLVYFETDSYSEVREVVRYLAVGLGSPGPLCYGVRVFEREEG